MKILVTLLTLLKFTRLIQGQAANPFRPSFGFRNSINDTNLSFGLNDDVTSITNRFSSNGKQSATRPVLPTQRTQVSGGRPNIPNFPVHVSKPTKPEITNQHVIEKSRFPNFPTPNLNTQSNFQNAFKQNTVVQPKGPNPLRQNTVVLPNIPNFPTATRRQQQLLSNRIVNPKGVLVNLNSPPKASVASVPTAQNANSITKATQTQGVSSLETVKEGLNVANQIASQISEDSIRKKFIDFFIQNTKNKKNYKHE